MKNFSITLTTLYTLTTLFTCVFCLSNCASKDSESANIYSSLRNRNKVTDTQPKLEKKAKIAKKRESFFSRLRNRNKNAADNQESTQELATKDKANQARVARLTKSPNKPITPDPIPTRYAQPNIYKSPAPIVTAVQQPFTPTINNRSLQNITPPSGALLPSKPSKVLPLPSSGRRRSIPGLLAPDADKLPSNKDLQEVQSRIPTSNSGGIQINP